MKNKNINKKSHKDNVNHSNNEKEKDELGFYAEVRDQLRLTTASFVLKFAQSHVRYIGRDKKMYQTLVVK